MYPAEPAPGPAAPGQELEERPLSRQVFIVQELEVRDRLASSQINKFLYLHTSERMPRRAHSNMVQATPAVHAGQSRVRTPAPACLGECWGSGGLSCGDSMRRCEASWARGGGRDPRPRGHPELALCPQLTIKALHVAPTTNLGGPECCLRVSLMPLRLNVDQVRRSDGGRAGGEPRCLRAWAPDLHLPLQDALLFLKDFFTSLAAGINPMVSVETSTEGERLSWEGRVRASHLPAIPRPIPNLCPPP